MSEHQPTTETTAPRDESGEATGAVTDTGRPRCSDCVVAQSCLPGALNAEQVRRFEEAMPRCRKLGVGDHLFRVGDPFRNLFAVRTGCLKTYAVDSGGREHVMAFHFPGELIGSDAIYPERCVSSCVALTPSVLCGLPFSTLTSLSRDIPELQAQLLRALSRDVLGTSSIAGDFTAEERLAGFLVMVSARLYRARKPAAALDLAMSRQDIANYLRLAPETVSRILARFQKSGLVKTDRKHITLLDHNGLMDIAACMNPYTRSGFSSTHSD
ncbi:MAG: helix-turn-helix domain-containing protein [Gammaproteobacteria bacterium]|nr:helix-turn-helix domain-containing protein [Gammaproteobacteria bacterium]